MGNDWGMAKNHGAIVGAFRIPGRGWPVKCPSCGNVGWFKERSDAQKAASNHRKNN